MNHTATMMSAAVTASYKHAPLSWITRCLDMSAMQPILLNGEATGISASILHRDRDCLSGMIKTLINAGLSPGLTARSDVKPVAWRDRKPSTGEVTETGQQGHL